MCLVYRRKAHIIPQSIRENSGATVARVSVQFQFLILKTISINIKRRHYCEHFNKTLCFEYLSSGENRAGWADSVANTIDDSFLVV
ncbi:unnamed protein product [Arabis nemorensis]|uniref:Uncharacterized protein n=1 Tax=Arabis nemorensis TaxID=586526 RepID=A0A565CLT7_9BRAS|nr:unnamed protein product [Arabis nemorensis]